MLTKLISKYIVEEILSARRKLMYHGTSSKLLRSILKKGLGFGKQRVWDVEKGKLESFGGVYLTSNFMIAHSATMNAKQKFGGYPLMILSDINLDQGTSIDEDSILPEINSAIAKGARKQKYNSAHLPSSLELLKQKNESNDYTHFLDIAYEDFKNSIMDKVDPKHKKRAEKVLSDKNELVMKMLEGYFILKTIEMIEREGDYYINQYYDINDFGTPPKWMFDYEKRKMKTTLKEFRKTTFRPLLKEVTDAVGRLMRGFSEESLNAFSFNHIRVPNVGYKGTRKIVLVIEELPFSKEEQYPIRLKIHYNKSSQALKRYLADFKQSQGDYVIEE